MRAFGILYSAFAVRLFRRRRIPPRYTAALSRSPA